MIDFGFTRSTCATGFLTQKKMKSKAAKILAYTAIAATAASMDNGAVNRYIESANNGPETNFNTYHNLSPEWPRPAN